MKRLILPLAILTILSVGVVSYISHKDVSSENSQITVSNWMSCVNTNKASCQDIESTADDYIACKQVEKQVDIETSPINCSNFWNFLNRATGNEYIDQSSYFSSCFLAHETNYQNSQFFYTQIFYPRYHTCSGL